MKFVPRSLIDNKPALVEVMAWRRTGNKPLHEPMMTLFTDAYIGGTKGWWVKWKKKTKIMFPQKISLWQGFKFLIWFYIPPIMLDLLLTLIPAWISNSIHYKMWNEITFPFPNFNGATIEVWEWVSNFIPHFTGHVIDHPYWNQSQFMLVKGALGAKDQGIGAKDATLLLMHWTCLFSPKSAWWYVLLWNIVGSVVCKCYKVLRTFWYKDIISRYRAPIIKMRWSLDWLIQSDAYLFCLYHYNGNSTMSSGSYRDSH